VCGSLPLGRRPLKRERAREHAKERGKNMVSISEINKYVLAYAPKLDIEEQLKFSMFIYNEFRDENNLNDLNLANIWQEYKK
jgi:hypothetical protein